MPDLKHNTSVAPSSVKMKRSTFSMPYNVKTTCNFGELIPFDVCEVLPGDTWSAYTKLFARMSTPLFPVMDNAFISYFYFFVPARLAWSSFAEFLGENKLSAWAPSEEKVLPHEKLTSQPGSLLDHFGIPTYSSDATTLTKFGFVSQPAVDVQVLPLRAYFLIWNEWFRSEAVTDPVLVNTGDNVTADEIALYQGNPLKAEKPFDMFTAALPSPQRGDPVDIPLYGDGYAPLVHLDGQPYSDFYSLTGADHTVEFATRGTSGTEGDEHLLASKNVGGDDGGEHLQVGYDVSTSLLSGDYTGPLYYKETYAALNDLDGATINQLRQAFQMQRLLELQARSGARYTEIIRASFSVISPDARLQRPEYLGGTTVQIQMQQVAQTSSTDLQSPLGHVGAYSKTVSGNQDFTFSATEHGYIIGVAVARHALSYQQGLERLWSRRGRFDLYWPTFAHIGEQPIRKGQLFYKDAATDSEPFGYNEAWIEYRCKVNQISGAFRSTVAMNLDEWHYADVYESVPTLSAAWLHADKTAVDRTLAVSSSTHDQLLLDVNISYTATRVMPLYSVPGLIDHF